MGEIYLDNSATTRPYDAVIEFAVKVQKEVYGNPSSLHAMGLKAERLLKEARGAVAAVLGGREDEVFFTSGGTEANNLAIKGAAYRNRRRGSHIITSSIEHPATLNCCRRLEQEGYTVSYLPVDRQGYIDLELLQRQLGAETILVSLIHINNEIGTVQPVDEIGALIKERNPDTLFHVDGVQSFAKIPVYPRRWGADLFSCSAHKIHGPKGVGALWVKKNTALQPLVQGGDQENNLRPGTENTAGIAGFGLAARLALEERAETAALVTRLKQKLCRGLLQSGLEFYVNGPDPGESAPHIVNLSFPGVSAEVLLHALEQHGIYTSPGSACHSRRPEPSHVLQAIGLSKARLAGALRFSFSGFNREEEIDQTVTQTVAAVKELGAMTP